MDIFSPGDDGVEKSIAPYYHETNTMEGSEFLDDAIRTTDQPFEEPGPNEKEQTKLQNHKNQLS